VPRAKRPPSSALEPKIMGTFGNDPGLGGNGDAVNVRLEVYGVEIAVDDFEASFWCRVL
jgi:hypothetical protein